MRPIKHPEYRPECGHQRRRDALHLVVLVGRHDRPYRQPRTEGDQEGEREPTDDEEPRRPGRQPVHAPAYSAFPLESHGGGVSWPAIVSS